MYELQDISEVIIWSSAGKRMVNYVQPRIVPASLDLIRTIKGARFQWKRHVPRMGNNEIPRRIINSKLEESRTVGKPKLRGWMDGVVQDFCGYWGSEDGGWSPGTASLG